MECSVCYGESGPFQKLCCGHSFCTGCIKAWYLKGTGTGCPMCRRPIYFKGFAKVRDQWNEDAWDTRCSEVLSAAIDECIAESVEMAAYFPPRLRKRVLVDAIQDIKDVERTFRFLKAADLTSEDIEYILMDTADYYSDRHMNMVYSYNEPPKPWISRYVMHKGSNRCGKRARSSSWFTVNFVVLI